jgi:hypothetical protein
MKNRILSLKKKPAFLILYGFIIIMVIFSVVMLLVFDQEIKTKHYADERILFSIIAALGLLYLWLFTNTGLSTGSSLFTMPDVGLLFVSPISSKKILMYGLLSTLGKSLLGSIFIIYQIGNLKSNFGYGFKEIFALFLIFALMVLFCQLLSIGVYIFSNSNSVRKKLVKVILYTAIASLIAVVLLIQRQDQVSMIEAVFRLVASRWFGYVPVTGWITMFFVGIVQGSLTMILIPLGLFLGIGIVIVSLLTVGTADYYEDVLLSTEVNYQKISAAKEGRGIPQSGNKKIKVKDKDQGINKGIGYMAIFHKHILEMKRKSRFIFIDNYTIFTMVGFGIAGYYFKMKNAPNAAVYGILATIIYFQYFLTMLGKLNGELLKPYIYLIPEKSIKKVFAASLTSLIKPCVDGVCMFTVLAVFGGINPLICLFSALAYSASGAVFVGLTILYQRVLGGQPNKIVQGFIGFGLLLAVMAPAIGVSVVAAFLLPPALNFLCTIPYTIFCLLFAAFMLAVCGNLIDKAEYTGRL